MVSYLDVLTILLIFFLTAAAQGRKSMASPTAQNRGRGCSRRS